MKIIEKLKKLIAHEKSARSIGNVKEAEIFADKIQQLLDSHNLSLSDVEIEAANSSINQSATGFYAHRQWQKTFAHHLAALNSCVMVLRGNEITLVGADDDCQIVIEIYRYFEKLARDFAQSHLNEWRKTSEYKRKRKKIYHCTLFKISFLNGFTFALITRFRERHEAAKEAATNQKALIFIGNKLTAAENWMKNNLELRKKREQKRQPLKFNNNAFLQGIQAGESVALTTQTIS